MTATVAVVTGAGRGLGREMALRLARSHTVVLAGRDLDALRESRRLIERHGGRAFETRADVRLTSDVDALRDEVEERVGPATVLVNNSGVGGPVGDLWTIAPEAWEETFAVNVLGTFLCCRAFLPGMIAQHRGSIINIGSITGKHPLLGRTAYAASKTALIGLTRTLAAETGPHGIRVNLVSPGYVAGARLDWVFENRSAVEMRPEQEVRDEVVGSIPLRRLVSAAEVAAVVSFLASADSAAITGQDINVAAGFVMH
ncbi:SDR family NAD(P)-dependent oxidoreductase [Nocardia amamiensis]|uniref:SDR family NAD(P)-dependent oxidoreductase n=1 Tax=Nocardia amamiensis TaxID=404578 RepID=UPI0033FEC8F6